MSANDEVFAWLGRLAAVEKQFGVRSRIPMGHSDPLLKTHARGEMADGAKFVWCPMGFLLSWHPGDYDNRFCPWCKGYFDELTEVKNG